MTVLDVGQGLAVVVQTHRHALLYDTGPRYTDECRRRRPDRRAVPARGGRRASRTRMIVSHQDSDHSGGALSLLQTVPVDWLASSLPEDSAILAQRAQDGGAALRCEAGQRWDWDGVRFAVLQPPAAHYAMPRLKTNDLSCVVRVESAYGSVLLTGDIEARGELGARARAIRGAQRGRAGRPASRQPHVVDAGVHRGGGRRESPCTRRATATGSAIRVRRSSRGTRLPASARIAPTTTARSRSSSRRASARAPRAEREHDRRYWREAPARSAVIPLGLTRALTTALRASVDSGNDAFRTRNAAPVAIVGAVRGAGFRRPPPRSRRTQRKSRRSGSCRPPSVPRSHSARRAARWAKLIGETSGGKLAVRLYPGRDACAARSGARISRIARRCRRPRRRLVAVLVGAGERAHGDRTAVARAGCRRPRSARHQTHPRPSRRRDNARWRRSARLRRARSPRTRDGRDRCARPRRPRRDRGSRNRDTAAHRHSRGARCGAPRDDVRRRPGGIPGRHARGAGGHARDVRCGTARRARRASTCCCGARSPRSPCSQSTVRCGNASTDEQRALIRAAAEQAAGELTRARAHGERRGAGRPAQARRHAHASHPGRAAAFAAATRTVYDKWADVAGRRPRPRGRSRGQAASP